MKEKVKHLDKYCMELPFKIVYLVFAFFTYCNLTYSKPIMSIMVDLVLGLGAIAVVLRILKIRGYMQTKGIVFLILFCISYVISMVTNYKYGISDNFKYLIWTGFHFFVFYMCDIKRDVKEYKKEFDIISWTFVFVSFILVFASLIMYYMGISIEEYDHQGGVFLAGVVWGRLWGTFTDPNYGSVFATLSIVFSYYKLTSTKKKAMKVFLGLNIVGDFFYIALSDSRTGIVCIFSCAFIYALMTKLKSKKGNYLKVALGVFIFSVVMAIVPVVIKNVNNSLITVEETITGDETEDDLTIGREDDLKGNFSNRRVDIWMSAFEIAKTRPIFGVSYFNIISYAKENTPETYLVNNDHGVFSNFHNMPLNVLVGQGIVGLGIMICFGIIMIMYVFGNVMKSDGEMYQYQVVLITGIVASLEASMFVTDVLYTNSPTSVIFWLFLGYLEHYIKNTKTVEDR